MATPPPPLPDLELEAPLPLLTRWLRVAGFRVRETPRPEGTLAGTDGGRWHRVRVAAPPDGTDPTLLVPDGDWRPQVAAIARHLGLGLRDLRPLRVCVPCGDELAFVPREEAGADLPEGRAPGERYLLRCGGCARLSWPGEAATAHRRELEALFLEHLFRCDRCGEEGGRGRNILRMEVLSDAGPVELAEEDLTRDHSAEIAALLRSLEGRSEEELADSVAFHREKLLCSGCKRELLRLLRGFFQEGT